MHDFKKGDTYVVVSPFEFEGKSFEQGDTFTVLSASMDLVSCAWERNVGGHSQLGECKPGHGWNVRTRILEPNVELFVPEPSWEL